LRDYANKKLPSTEMLPKILRSQFGVPNELADECAAHLAANGRFVDVVREIGGSPHVLLDAELSKPAPVQEPPETGDSTDEPAATLSLPSPIVHSPAPPRSQGSGPKPIFVGHGKNKGPLQQLQGLLTTFQIPHKVVVD
jgi:hypothetical protein